MTPICFLLTTGLALAACAFTLHAETFPVAEDTAGSPLTIKISKATGAAKTLAISAKSTAYLAFDVKSSGIAAANVNAARLTIYFPTVTKAGTLSLHNLATGFTETFATPTIPIPTLDAAFATIPLTSADARHFVIIDVTTQVKAWLTTPADEHGLAIKGDGTVSCLIASKEGPGSGHPAVLELDLAASTVGGVIAANVAMGANLANAATVANTASTIVKRDASGSLFAGTVTATTFIGDGSQLTGVAIPAEAPANVIPVLGMIWIKPGTFIMGSRADEPGRIANGPGNEGPQTVVTLTKGLLRNNCSKLRARGIKEDAR